MARPRLPISLLALVAAGVATLSLSIGQASAARMQGIDVSRFQGKINWQRVAGAGIEFAFVQASRGSGSDCAVAPTRCGPDEFYERNYRRARKVGIPIGAYHRAFVGGTGDRGVKRDARIEARLFLSLVGELRGRDLLPALDVETPFAGLTQRELRIWVRTWLARVEKELGVKPFIYTNHSSWQATGDTTMFARAGHPLWVANFDVRAPKVPAANWNGQGWSIWQYTSSGRVGGISGNVDRNALRIPLEAISVKRARQP